MITKHRCKICRRDFSSSHELTQYRNAKHNGRIMLSQPSEGTHRQRSQKVPEYDINLWKTLITMPALETKMEGNCLVALIPTATRTAELMKACAKESKLTSTVLVENPISEID